MTEQMLDSIEYMGETFYFHSNIFYEFLESRKLEVEFDMIHTANYRGMYESYVIVDNKIYLKDFFGNLRGDLPRKNFPDYDEEGEYFNVDKYYFFSEKEIKNNLILADWFCGVIEIRGDLYSRKENCYHMIIDYGEIIEVKSFKEGINRHSNPEAIIYNYVYTPSVNDTELYKYKYDLISKLSKYDYFLEGKNENDLFLLARDFNSYKGKLELKSYYEKKSLFDSEILRLQEESHKGKAYLEWEWDDEEDEPLTSKKNRFLDEYGYLLKDYDKDEIDLVFRDDYLNKLDTSKSIGEIQEAINLRLPLLKEIRDLNEKREKSESLLVRNKLESNSKIDELNTQKSNYGLWIYLLICVIAGLYLSQCDTY